MEEVRTKERLSELRRRDGFIFNCFYPFARRFTTFGTLHKIKCDCIDKLSTKNNAKFYFSSLGEATAWLDANAKQYENKPWKKCGVCLKSRPELDFLCGPIERSEIDTERQKLELDMTEEFRFADGEATLLIDETK